jgi:hypothetical protein
LPPRDQEDVNEVIDLGATYLQKNQGPEGTWTKKDDAHAVAYAALPGLTLLECGVPATDKVIQKAARFVRRNSAKLKFTYDLALAVLFLDRLGEAKDRKLIQALTLRLVAGQTPTGGWSYVCPVLNSLDHQQLFTVLRKLTPKVADPVATGGVRNPGRLRFERSGRCIKMTEGVAPDPEPEPDRPLSPPPKKAPPAKKPPVKVKIPSQLRLLPVLRDPKKLTLEDPKDKPTAPLFGTTDNSNTQFAILALWVARRHGVPTDRTLRLMVRRFETSQNADGGWGYHYKYGGGEGGSPAMNAVGLLGLAVGHGLTPGGRKAQPGQDPKIVKGFVALAQHIGTPAGRWKDLKMQNLYFLWTVERVGVLYDLSTIGRKDWYRWGAEILVANQQADGNWENKGAYPGATPTIDTCLALLFLKRVNLIKELTDTLPFDPTKLTKEIAKKVPPSDVGKDKQVETPRPEPSPDTRPPKKKGPPVDNLDPSQTGGNPSPGPAPKPEGEPKKEESGDSGGGPWGWILGLLGVLLLALGGLFLYQRSAPAEAEKPRPRKKKKRPPQSPRE